MGIEHLKHLRTALENDNWLMLDELRGNEYDISGYWVIARPNGDTEFSLAFEGLDDMRTLPLEQAYGCHIEGHKEVSLYFGKMGKSFPRELTRFVSQLSCLTR